MSVIAAKLVAVFLVCGTGSTPQNPNDYRRICVAHVFPAVAVRFDDCLDAVQAEATQGELKLAKGGFVRTTNQSFCYTPGDPDYGDEVLTRHMVDDMGAVASKVLHYSFDGHGFKVVDPTPRIPGQRM